jgi:tetratricopeptide (TPR) repeat protein
MRLLLGVCFAALPAQTGSLRADPADEIAETLASCQNEDKVAELRARACTSLIGTPNVDPDIRAEALLNRGILKQEADDLDGAIADYTAAIVLNPEYPALYAHRAEAYEEKEKFELAIADWTTVIRHVPDDADAYASRGDIYVQLDDREKAINDYRAALELEPANAQAQKGLESLGVKSP